MIHQLYSSHAKCDIWICSHRSIIISPKYIYRSDDRQVYYSLIGDLCLSCVAHRKHVRECTQSVAGAEFEPLHTDMK